jgi:hypothetical protein
VLDFPSPFRGEFFPTLSDSCFAAYDGLFSAADVAFEPVDPVEQRGFVVAAPAAELRKATEVGQFPPGVLQPPDRFLPVLEGVGELPLGVANAPEPLGRAGGQDRLMFRLFGEEFGEAAGRVVDGEAGVGDAPEGVEDFFIGGALVGEDAAVVDVGEAGDVPGVGGVPGAALPGVAGEAFQGCRSEKVDLGPGAGLDAVDRPHPGVGQVRAAVGAVTLDERAGKDDGSAAVVDGPQAVFGHGGHGEDGAVVEAQAAGAEGAVDQDAVAGGVAAFAVVPGRADQLGAVDVARVLETVADAVGEVFAVVVGDGEGDDPGGAVDGEVGGDGGGEGFASGVGGAEVVFPAVLGADGLAKGDVAGPVAGQRLCGSPK